MNTEQTERVIDELGRIADELGHIADALEHFATSEAEARKRKWIDAIADAELREAQGPPPDEW